VQPLEGRRRQHVSRAPSTPISFGPAGQIHPCVIPQVSSCNGAIASAAADDHAKLINAEVASRLSLADRLK